jgi:hypothetical protein
VSGEPVEGGVPVGGIQVRLPVCVRSRLPDDVIQTASGITQELNALFGASGVPGGLRDLLPVVETAGEPPEIRFVCGEVAGFRNWKAYNAPEGTVAYLFFKGK